MNDIVKTDDTKNLPIAPLPEGWEEELRKQAQEAASMEAVKSPYLSIRSGVLSWQQQPIPGNKLQAVILDSVFERSYYTEAYNPSDIAPPLCFAVNRIEAALHPHENGEKVQFAGACSNCPQSQWKSDPNGRAQACKLRRRLVLLSADCLGKGQQAILEAEVLGLKVPPTSTVNFGNYVQQVSGVIKRPPWGVISVISVKPHPKFQVEVTFSYGGQLDESQLAAVMAKRKEIGDRFLTPWAKIDPEQAKLKIEARAAEGKAKTERQGKRKFQP